MIVSKLTRLIPVPAGYFIVSAKSIKKGEGKALEFTKLPVLAWGTTPDEFDLQPVTTLGVYEGAYTLLLPNGAVHDPYGDITWFGSELDWMGAVTDSLANGA